MEKTRADIVREFYFPSVDSDEEAEKKFVEAYGADEWNKLGAAIEADATSPNGDSNGSNGETVDTMGDALEAFIKETGHSMAHTPVPVDVPARFADIPTFTTGQRLHRWIDRMSPEQQEKALAFVMIVSPV